MLRGPYFYFKSTHPLLPRICITTTHRNNNPERTIQRMLTQNEGNSAQRDRTQRRNERVCRRAANNDRWTRRSGQNRAVYKYRSEIAREWIQRSIKNVREIRHYTMISLTVSQGAAGSKPQRDDDKLAN